MKKPKQKSFRKGQIVQCGETVVLVTGVGSKKEGYPCFAGVVLIDIKREIDEFAWSVGTYSETWSLEPFERADIKLSFIHLASDLK